MAFCQCGEFSSPCALVSAEEISFDLQVICFLVLGFLVVFFFLVYDPELCWLGMPCC